MKRKWIRFITIFFIMLLIPVFAKAEKETLILLDQSASMYEPFGDNLKFYYAKQAVIKILNNYNDSDYIG